MLGDRSAAEEVTAIAFERGFRARATFYPGGGTPRAWMFDIARNAAVDELRRRGRIAELPPDPEDRTSPGPPELADAGARRAVVLRALDNARAARARAGDPALRRRAQPRRDRGGPRRDRDQRLDHASSCRDQAAKGVR